MKKILKYLVGLLLLVIVGYCAIYWKNDIPLETLKQKYAQPPSKFIEIDEMQVHYRDEGVATDSLPIVLIHGTGSSLHTWQGWVAALKNEHRIIRMDLPAYGLTGPNPTGDYSMNYYADFMAKFLGKLGVKHCILGGNSLGGSVTWHTALKYPDLVKKMILVDAGGYPMQSTSVPIAFRMAKIPVINALFKYITPRSIVEKSVQNVYVNDEKITPELVDRYYELSCREGNRQAFVERMNKVFWDDNYLKIKMLAMPTLILWGEKDGLIPENIAEKFHADLPHGTLVVLKNLGHVPMEEDPAATVAVVKSFLEK